MIWLTNAERWTLMVLGVSALVGLGVIAWQQRHGPLTVIQGQEPPYAEWEAKLADARQVDVNEATAEELERLPQIGPSLAQRIVEYRQAHGPFASPEQLREVPGIGPSTYAMVRDRITVKE